MKIVIDKKEVNYFNSGSITLKLDSIASTFEFATYFKPNDKEFQEILKPLQYKDVEIYNSKNNLIFTGTILNHRFTSNSGRELVIISGYSKCGILEDVCVPPSKYPLESTNKSLKDIFDILLGIETDKKTPFSISEFEEQLPSAKIKILEENGVIYKYEEEYHFKKSDSCINKLQN